MFPVCHYLSPVKILKLLVVVWKDMKTIILPTYIILKLCFKAQERGGCSVLSIYPLYIDEALKLRWLTHLGRNSCTNVIANKPFLNKNSLEKSKCIFWVCSEWGQQRSIWTRFKIIRYSPIENPPVSPSWILLRQQ